MERSSHDQIRYTPFGDISFFDLHVLDIFHNLSTLPPPKKKSHSSPIRLLVTHTSFFNQLSWLPDSLELK